MQIKTNRYDAIDAYILSELEYEYINANNQDKLEILKKIYLSDNDAKYRITYELAKKFIENADNYALMWLAKNGSQFDYRDRDHSSDDKPCKYPDRNLWEYFEKHPDKYIRTAIYENSDYHYPTESLIPYSYGIRDLEKIDHIKRLSLVRKKTDHPFWLLSIATELFKKDSDVKFLSKDELNELRKAILTNNALVNYTREIIADSRMTAMLGSDLAKLWHLIYDCDDYQSKEIAFRTLGGQDKVKASIYKKLLNSLESPNEGSLSFENTGNNWLRYNLILNSTTNDCNTVLLGTQDGEGYIAYLAEKKCAPKPTINAKYYIKKYYGTVLRELFTLFIVLASIAQFQEPTQMLLICAIFYSYIILNYKTTNSLLISTRQGLTLLANIKLVSSSKEEIENNDKDIAAAVNILQSETMKLYIIGINAVIISAYLICKFFSVIA